MREDAAEGRIILANWTRYAYDADGQRVAKFSGAPVTNQYVYNLSSQPMAEVDDLGNWLRSGIYLGKYDNTVSVDIRPIPLRTSWRFD